MNFIPQQEAGTDSGICIPEPKEDIEIPLFQETFFVLGGW